MKFKKLIATTMALSMVLTFSGCTSKSSDADKNSGIRQALYVERQPRQKLPYRHGTLGLVCERSAGQLSELETDHPLAEGIDPFGIVPAGARAAA